MNGTNKKLTNLLAQAILDINAQGADVLEVIDRLNCDMRDIADTSEPLMPLRKYNEEWKAPVLETMTRFYDQNEFEREVPQGYRLRVAFVTNKSWCGTYDTSTQEPNYHEVPDASGAEYVDVFLERVAMRDCDIPKANTFRHMLQDSHMLKTMNSFGTGTAVPCEYMRFTIMHDKFREEQLMDTPE